MKEINDIFNAEIKRQNKIAIQANCEHEWDVVDMYDGEDGSIYEVCKKCGKRK